MTERLRFSVDFEVTQTAPTGDPCERCHDIPYLTAWLWLILIDSIVSQQVYLCESCTDALRDESGGESAEDDDLTD